MKNNHFVNAYRTKEMRRVRYCFLRQCGLCRNATRAIVGRNDTRMMDSLKEYWEMEIKLRSGEKP